MNKAILIGRLTSNPEMRTTTQKNNCTTFTLAINRPYENSDGERQADFINCRAWNKAAENIYKYCKKGNLIAVEGNIRTDNYEASDGTRRYITYVLVSSVQFLSNAEKKEEHSPEKDIVKQDTKSDPFAEFGQEVELTDEDLPF